MRTLRKITSRASSSIDDPTEYTTQITDLLGVDYSHSQLFVDDTRGTSMLNFIKKNGITQKRNGWKEVKWYDNNNELTQFTNKINGVWVLPITEYNETTQEYDRTNYLIVQSGKEFYQVNYDSDDEFDILDDNNELTFTKITFDNDWTNSTDYADNINDDLSYGVVEEGVLYILCGTYIKIGHFEGNGDNVITARLVQNDVDTYVPTISYGATFEEYNNTEWTNTDVSLLTAKTYEEYNMLSNKVKETKLGLSYNSYMAYINNGDLMPSDTQVFSFPLTLVPYDVSNNNKYDVDISLKVNGTELTNTSTNNDGFTPSITIGSGIVMNKTATKCDTISEVENASDFAFCLQYRNAETNEIVSDPTSYDRDKLLAYIITNKLYAPLIEGEDNYKVEYMVNTGQAQKINNCRFGIVYGINNNQNRLFVSGNKSLPNVDWHTSQPIDNSYSSFTYFGDLSYTKLGSELNSIAGYEIASDGTMIIMKSPSNVEPTIYLRTAELTHPINSDGSYDESVYIEGYPVQTGSVGEGVIGFNNVQNLNGDTLIVSPNGVYGIEIDKAVNTNQRFALNRSRLIDTVLSSKNLKYSSTYVFDNKLFLSVDGMCYIADARYKSQLDDDLSGHYQYEWWVWDNVNARVFFEFNGKLFFGTEEGHIIGFDDKNYIDTSFATLKQSKGEIMFDVANNLVILPRMLSTSIEKLHEKDIIKITNNNDKIHLLILDNGNVDVNGDTITVLDDTFELDDLLYFYNDTFAIDNVYVNGELTNNYYENIKIIDVDLDNRTFRINQVLTGVNDFRLSKIPSSDIKAVNVQATVNQVVESASEIEGNILYSEVLQNENGSYYYYDSEDNRIELGILVFNQFQIAEYVNTQYKVFKIITFNNEILNDIIFNVEYNNIVKCYFVSKTFNFGTSIYFKKIKQLTLTPDEANGTSIDFGYETSRNGQMFNAYTGKAFDFNDLDFEDFSFEGSKFAKSYTKRIRDAFNFIRFIFKNETNNNCKISNLTILYTVGTKTKGVV